MFRRDFLKVTGAIGATSGLTQVVNGDKWDSPVLWARNEAWQNLENLDFVSFKDNEIPVQVIDEGYQKTTYEEFDQLEDNFGVFIPVEGWGSTYDPLTLLEIGEINSELERRNSDIMRIYKSVLDPFYERNLTKENPQGADLAADRATLSYDGSLSGITLFNGVDPSPGTHELAEILNDYTHEELEKPTGIPLVDNYAVNNLVGIAHIADYDPMAYVNEEGRVVETDSGTIKLDVKNGEFSSEVPEIIDEVVGKVAGHYDEEAHAVRIPGMKDSEPYFEDYQKRGVEGKSGLEEVSNDPRARLPSSYNEITPVV